MTASQGSQSVPRGIGKLKRRWRARKKGLIVVRSARDLIKDTRYPCSKASCPSNTKRYKVDFLIQSDSLDPDHPIAYNTLMSNKETVDQLKKLSKVPPRDGTTWARTPYSSPYWSADTQRKGAYATAGAWGRKKKEKAKQAWPITIPHSPLGSPYAVEVTRKNREWSKLKDELEKRIKIIFKVGNILHIPNPLYPGSRKKDLLFRITSYDWPSFPKRLVAEQTRKLFEKSPFGFVIVPRGSELVIIPLVYLEGSLIKAAEEKKLLAEGIKRGQRTFLSEALGQYCARHVREFKRGVRGLFRKEPPGRSGAYGRLRHMAAESTPRRIRRPKGRRGGQKRHRRTRAKRRRKTRRRRRKTRRASGEYQR